VDIKTNSTTISGYFRPFILAAAFAFGIGCGGGDGPEDIHDMDTVAGDVMTDIGEVQEHDEGLADPGRDEQSAETGGDTTGDVDDPWEVQDADQDTHVPSGVVEVIPAEIVMHYSATTKVRMATLTVKNVGDADLNIDSIAIMDPTCDASTCLFSITNTQLHDPEGNISTGTGPVQPEGFVTVELKFELIGTEGGNNSASLKIVSDSTVNPLVTVPMRATIIGAGACRLQMVPDKINFGVVPVGFPKTMEVRLINTGTASCLINAMKIADCQKNGKDVVCPDPLTGDDSAVFSLTSDETLIGATVLAGQQTSMRIVYTPPMAGEDTTTYGAVLSMQYEDPAGQTVVLPSCGGTGIDCVPNLAGAIVLDTNLYPQTVDFGLVRTGCGTAQVKVCYYNTSETPLPVKVDASQVGPEFVFEDFPEDWDDAIKGVPWCIQVDYRPTDAGPDTFTVTFHEDLTPPTGQILTLTGEGHTVDGVMDLFTGHSGQTEFDVRGIPVPASVVVTINDFECDDWSVGGTDLDATIVLGESCPVEHLDEVLILYDLDCVVPLA